MTARTLLSLSFCILSIVATPLFSQDNAATPPIDKPDLDVTFISQTPR